jgi:glycosyltransferase involved in cell wall biosynthesis
MSPDSGKRLVSVVVPVYNHARYILQCLDSVLDQTHRPLQIIVIDDGSKDDSPAIIREYLQRLGELHDIEVVFRARENRGAHHTINEGLEAATGEFIAILNSDDYYHPERIEKCLHACEAARADLAFTYVEAVGDDGSVLPPTHSWRVWYNAACISEYAAAPSIGFVLFEGNLAVSTGNLFFRRTMYQSLGPFRDYVIAHDLDFLLRALLVTEPLLIKEKLYYYRVHSANTIYAQIERTEEELVQIYAAYLRAVAAGPPRNPLAPCHWHWPSSFEHVFGLPRLARARDRLIQKPEPRAVDGPAPRGAAGALPAASRDREITVLTHELTLTGAPKVALEVTAMLIARGMRPSVVSLSEGPLRKQFEELGVPVQVLQTHWITVLAEAMRRRAQKEAEAGRPAPILRALARIFGVLARLSVRIPLSLDLVFLARLLWAVPKIRRRVFANSFASWPVVFALSKLRSFDRMLWFIHESVDPTVLLRGAHSKNAFAQAVRRPWMKFAFGSDATRAIWAAAGADGVTRYWSGLPRGACAPVRRQPGAPIRSLLSVGSSVGRKGVRQLMEAFALARNQGWLPEEAVLTIVGFHAPSQSPYSADLVVRAQQPDFGGRLVLVPSVEAKALDRYYQNADLYVQSSTSECLPLALLSAMAHGLPIVTTDADGCREAIADGESGHLVAPRSIAVLARAIADAVADPERSYAMGRAARAAFEERFCLENTAAALLETIVG